MNNWKKMYEYEKARNAELTLKFAFDVSPGQHRIEGKDLGRKEIAEIMLDLLDLHDQYPSKKVFNYASFSGPHEVEVPGSIDFVKDLIAARGAINGQASLKKIRKVLKKKEEN